MTTGLGSEQWEACPCRSEGGGEQGTRGEGEKREERGKRRVGEEGSEGRGDSAIKLLSLSSSNSLSPKSFFLPPMMPRGRIGMECSYTPAFLQ